MDKMFFPPRQATTRGEVASGAVRAAQDRDSALLDHGFGEKDVIVAETRASWTGLSGRRRKR
jgi:hypothetical protein